jgi:ketosteroid isomerase-like protein
VLDSPNVRVVKDFWDLFENQGLVASMEAMLEVAHDDVELRPYVGDGRTFHGPEEIREYIRQHAAEGSTLHARPWSFEEEGDSVIVQGSIRLQRADGSIADAQLRWTYTFRDGRLVAASSGPLAA